MSEIYTSELSAIATTLEASRLWWDRHELHGQLAVHCKMAGAKTIDGSLLHLGTFNFSSPRAHSERAKIISQRALTNGTFDWILALETFSQKVISAEERGKPGQDLRTFERPILDNIVAEGLVFPREHPSILFGDGGTAKSYTALYISGLLAIRGMRIAFFDWELSGNDHRYRLELLFPNQLPPIHYVRCDLPLTAEAERLRREVKENKIDYAVYDSIAFACDGPPESAEIASKYFRSVRQVGCGSLHIAHINKSENADQKPFGSSFWHNGARCTWYVQGSEPGDDGTLRVGFYNRKSNLGPLHKPASFSVQFAERETVFRRADIADTPEFASKLSVRQRMWHFLRTGAKTMQEICIETEAEAETVKRTIRRYKSDFIVLDGGKVGLCERRA